MAVAGIFSMWSGFGSVVVSFFPAAGRRRGRCFYRDMLTDSISTNVSVEELLGVD